MNRETHTDKYTERDGQRERGSSECVCEREADGQRGTSECVRERQREAESEGGRETAEGWITRGSE